MRVIGSVAVVPSDAEFTRRDAEGNYPDAIYAETAGNVELELIDGSRMTLAIEAGEDRAYSFRRVLNTGTTATGIRGLFLK